MIDASSGRVTTRANRLLIALGKLGDVIEPEWCQILNNACIRVIAAYHP
jgi:hypothetical protein